jgi:hypothetical protein
MEEQTRTIRLKVSPPVARLIAPGVSAEEQLQAIAGTLPLSDGELLTALFLLAHRAEKEIRRQACIGLRKLSAGRLVPLLADETLHPQLLQFIASYRADDAEVIDRLVSHPGFDRGLLPLVARRGDRAVLELLITRFAGSPEAPGLCQAAAENPAVDDRMLARLAGEGDEHSSAAEDEPAADQDLEEPWDEAESGDDEEDEETPEEAGDEEAEDEEGAESKYQMTMHMGVSEKIKAALSGDKEWRKLLLQDNNKLVSSAVLKNPRITDGEVLVIAKNKSSSEEMIRIITQNREWMKNYAIKQALVIHPRVPPGQAIRYMGTLTERDLKVIAKSREVAKVIVNNARRMLTAMANRR